jgi:hypothetical protein
MRPQKVVTWGLALQWRVGIFLLTESGSKDIFHGSVVCLDDRHTMVEKASDHYSGNQKSSLQTEIRNSYDQYQVLAYWLSAAIALYSSYMRRFTWTRNSDPPWVQDGNPWFYLWWPTGGMVIPPPPLVKSLFKEQETSFLPILRTSESSSVGVGWSRMHCSFVGRISTSSLVDGGVKMDSAWF